MQIFQKKLSLRCFILGLHLGGTTSIQFLFPWLEDKRRRSTPIQPRQQSPSSMTSADEGQRGNRLNASYASSVDWGWRSRWGNRSPIWTLTQHSCPICSLRWRSLADVEDSSLDACYLDGIETHRPLQGSQCGCAAKQKSHYRRIKVSKKTYWNFEWSSGNFELINATQKAGREVAVVRMTDGGKMSQTNKWHK